MIKFRCPHCNQKLGVPDNYANHRIRCSKCNEPSRVPAPADFPSVETVTKQVTQTPAASQSQQRMNTEQFFERDKQDSVNIQLQTRQTPVESEPVDEFEELEFVEESSNREAIRQAREAQRQKTSARSASGKSSKRSRKEKTSDSSGGGFSLASILDFIPDALRLPIGLAASVAAVGLMIGIWMVACRSTENSLAFIALFIPLAGAVALRVFTVERTFVLALMGTLIGGLGIAAGKYAIAKHVVIPWCHEQVNKEVLLDMKSLLADEKYQLPRGESAKFVAQDGDFMECIALISLVDDGQADPKAARKWVKYILLASNKTNIYAHLMSVLGSGPDAPPRPEMEGEDEAMFELASQRLGQWFEEECELRKARQYFAALNRISEQANLERLMEKPETAMKFAILSTLGLFEVVWVLVGMALAYATLAFD